MIGKTGVTTPAPSLIKLWVIHCAHILSVPIYAALYTYILLPDRVAHPVNAGSAPQMSAVLGAVSVVCIVMGLTARRWVKPRFRPINVPEGSVAYFYARTMACLVFSDSCFSSIAVYGFIGNFLGFTPWQSYLFMGVSLIFLLLRSLALYDWIAQYQLLKSNEENAHY